LKLAGSVNSPMTRLKQQVLHEVHTVSLSEKFVTFIKMKLGPVWNQ
jgi:hypothetical protein